MTNCYADAGSPPGCPAFGQINGFPDSPTAVDNLLLSTMTLTALQPGLVEFSWLSMNKVVILHREKKKLKVSTKLKEQETRG